MKNVEAKAKELGNDVANVKRELKRVASLKCRLKKQSGRSDYEDSLTKLLKEEELLKQVRQLLTVKPKSVTEFEQSDVDNLDYDETVKALKSIQSKKSNSAWLTTEFGDNDEFRHACKIEQMLKAHREVVKPVADGVVRKSEIQALIETFETTPDITTETIIEKLTGLL